MMINVNVDRKLQLFWYRMWQGTVHRVPFCLPYKGSPAKLSSDCYGRDHRTRRLLHSSTRIWNNLSHMLKHINCTHLKVMSGPDGKIRRINSTYQIGVHWWWPERRFREGKWGGSCPTSYLNIISEMNTVWNSSCSNLPHFWQLLALISLVNFILAVTL